MSDLISRQAAIDKIESLMRTYGDEVYPLTETDKAINYAIELAASCIYNLPSAQQEIIHCNSCKYWTQSTGEMKGYGLGMCDFHDADLVTCNGFCYWAERGTDE